MTFGDNVQSALEAGDDAAEAFRVGRQRLLAHVALRGSRWSPPPHPRARGVVLLGALVATAAFALAWHRQPLSFRVGDRPGRVGDVVEVTHGDTVGVRFSEGSALVVQRGTRMRVLSTERTGARVLVENGTVDVAIAHRPRQKARWRFEAGPIAVLVTGTKFRVAWDEPDQLFTLDVTEGSVMVSGGCGAGPRQVVAPDRLHLSCLPPIEAAVPVAPVVVSPPDLAALLMPPPVRAARPLAAPPAPPGEDWRALLAAGRFDEGLRAAERTGFAQVCATANDGDLLALADAARLSGRSARAVEALSVLRARFPGSTSAATAAFALGRIAFEWRANYDDAAHWFAAYLDEDPTGPLMGDAMGRLIESRDRAGDHVDARREAERYLRRFPRGPYAATATAILSQ